MESGIATDDSVERDVVDLFDVRALGPRKRRRAHPRVNRVGRSQRRRSRHGAIYGIPEGRDPALRVISGNSRSRSNRIRETSETGRPCRIGRRSVRRASPGQGARMGFSQVGRAHPPHRDVGIDVARAIPSQTQIVVVVLAELDRAAPSKVAVVVRVRSEARSPRARRSRRLGDMVEVPWVESTDTGKISSTET